MVKLQIFKANEGDSFLLSFDDNKKHILIDMGTFETYSKQIRNELVKLASKKEEISLLIISHIDNDHIGGAIPFLSENGKERKIINVNDIWFNSYKHLQFSKEYITSIPKKEKNILTQIKECNKYRYYTSEPITSSIGVKEGISLAYLISSYQYNWNKSFNNLAATLENNNFIRLDDNISFYILSPNQSKLNKLSDYWLKILEKYDDEFKISNESIFDEAFELYFKNYHEEEITIKKTSSSKETDLEKMLSLEQNDKSYTNGSSIAFILQYKGTKMLFLGDAHEDIIYEELSKLKEKGYYLTFDLVKLSHHGSNRNISNRFLNLIQSKRFIISTNGKKYSHPSKETIAKIVKKRTPFKKTLIFNYKIDSIFDMFEKYQQLYNFEMKIQNEILL